MLVFVPVSAQHFETAYLTGGTHMLPDAETNIIVANADKAKRVGGIVGETLYVHLCRDFITRNIFECDGQVLFYQPLHLALDILFFLPGRLVIQMKTHLALLALYVGIVRTVTPK